MSTFYRESMSNNVICCLEQKIKETTVQESHILHCEAIHIKTPALQISHILHGGFQTSKRGFFDVCFDLSCNALEKHY